MARAACLLAAAMAGTSVASDGLYSYFCQRRSSDGKLLNSCRSSPDCNGTGTFIASAVFTSSDGVCEGFAHSDPACEAVTHHCYEAVDFQLIWDRSHDFVDDFKHEDWAGISMMFHNSSAIFVPGSHGFTYQPAVEAALAAYHKNHPGLVEPVVRQVLTAGGEEDEKRVIHSTGVWQSSNKNGTQLPFYARWISNKNDHWVMESLVTQLGDEFSLSPGQQDDRLFNEISKRAADFTDLYNRGDFQQLAGMYSGSAVIIPVDSRPIVKADFTSYFGSKPFGSTAKLESKIVAQAPGNDAVHEVGYSSSTRSGYLARWVKDGKSNWVIETQLLAVFPKDRLIDTEFIV